MLLTILCHSYSLYTCITMFIQIANVYDICEKRNVRLCYSKTKAEGFPCSIELTKKLVLLSEKASGAPTSGLSLASTPSSNRPQGSPLDGNGDTAFSFQQYGSGLAPDGTFGNINSVKGNLKGYGSEGSLSVNQRLMQSQSQDTDYLTEYVHIADTLDQALAWAEDSLIDIHFRRNGLSSRSTYEPPQSVYSPDSPRFSEKPAYLQQMYALLSRNVSVADSPKGQTLVYLYALTYVVTTI